MTLPLAREIHALFAKLDVAGIHDLGNDVSPFPEIVVHQIGFTVPHLIDAEFLGSRGLDVGELVVVVDRLNVEWRLVGFERIIKFQLQWIRALIFINGLLDVGFESRQLPL